MRTEAFASPLTVWVGTARYVFHPGRDVIVGYGGRCDIPLDRVWNAAPTPQTDADLVLRFTGTHWVAIDRSPNGFFVDGARMSAVDIRDGQAITIGDPQRGPRLIFNVGPSPGPAPGPPAQPPGPPPGLSQRPAYPPPAPPPLPPPGVAAQPHQAVPTQRETQRMRIPPPQPRAVEPPNQPAALGPTPLPPVQPPAPTMPPMTMPPMTMPPVTTPPITMPPITMPPMTMPPMPMPPVPEPPQQPVPQQPVPQPPVSEDEQPKGRGLIGRVTDATRKLLPAHPEPQPGELGSTFRLPLKPGARTVGVAAYRLGLTVDERELLTSVSFAARPGTLTAVFGPSAARNSTLISLLAGTRVPSSGEVTVDDRDVHAQPESMRTRIGIVTNDDCVHPRLTVERALGYEAELRLPPDTAPDHRRRVVDQVLDELELTPHRATRIGKLSPEVRRCVSMAIELITRPTLLVVDEPGAGLDAAQETHVMAILRRQADLGCVVVVAITSTSVNHLNMCDQVLLLTPAGALAFVGPPQHIESAMGTADWSEVLARVSADPHGAHRAFRARQQTSILTTPPTAAKPGPPPAELPVKRQIRLVARRQVRLLVAHWVYLLFLAILPFALAGLTLLIPGDSGLDRAGPGSRNAHEAIEILAALNFAAVILGTALTVRDLVLEHRVFRREQYVGLSTPAYVAGKIIVFSVVAAIQAAVLTTIVILVKGGPVHGAVLLHNADVELYVSVAVTAIVSAIVGLALSSLGKSLREVLPLLVPVILASLLFAGGLVRLVGTWGFDQISWFVPAQWGFAASGSTVDLRRVDALAANAQMWTHYSGWWVFDMTMLVLFGAMWAGFVLFRLRQPKREIRSLHREQQELGDLSG
jgi:ABC transport system ATP-binding/permease protein